MFSVGLQPRGEFVHTITLDADVCNFMYPVDISTLRGEDLHNDESLNYFHFKTMAGSVRLITTVYPPVSREVRFSPPNHIFITFDKKDVLGGQLSVTVSRIIVNECMGCGRVIKKYRSTGLIHACPHCVVVSKGEIIRFNPYCGAGCRMNHLDVHARGACRAVAPPEVEEHRRDVQEGRVRNASLPGDAVYTLPAGISAEYPLQPLDNLRTLVSAALSNKEIRSIAGVLHRSDGLNKPPAKATRSSRSPIRKRRSV